MRGDPSVLCGVFGMVCNGFGARARPPAPERSRAARLTAGSKEKQISLPDPHYQILTTRFSDSVTNSGLRAIARVAGVHELPGEAGNHFPTFHKIKGNQTC